jgi:hypothetical protein
MRAFLLVLPALLLPFAHASVPRAPEEMCTTPKLDTAKWSSFTVASATLMLPRASSQAENGPYYKTFRIGGRAAGLLWSDAGWIVPDSFYYAAARLAPGQHPGGPNSLGNASTMGSSRIDGALASLCNTVIANRPVEISTYVWNLADAPMTMTAGSGKHYLAVARWPAATNTPVMYMWFASDYKSDLMQMRQMFWTMQFPGFAPAPPACADTSPPPRGTVGEFLDTSLVAMLVNGASPAIPKGSGTVLLRFDSTGNVAGVSVGATLMPDAAQKQLGAIVGSNVIAQKPGSVSHVRIKVTVGDSALSYALVGVGNCTH